MKIKTCTPVLVGAAALAGAVLRGLNLLRGYEPGTQLPIRSEPAGAALIALTAAAAVLLIVIALRWRADRGIRFEDAFDGSGALFKTVSVIAGLILFAAGAAGLYVAVSGASSLPLLQTVPLYPLWLLAMLTGGSFIGIASALSRRNITESTAALTIVPMFWACFDLIITYKDNGASPFVRLYGFELLAAVLLTYAFYALAGFLYSSGSPARFIFSAGGAVVLCGTVVGGAAISLLSGSEIITFSASTLLRYACFFAAGLWLFAMLILLSRSSSAKP